MSVDGQKHFNYGQIYVAISQHKTLEGIHMLGEIEKKKTCQSKFEGVVHKPAIVRKIEGSSIYNDKCAKYGISSKRQRRHKI